MTIRTSGADWALVGCVFCFDHILKKRLLTKAKPRDGGKCGYAFQIAGFAGILDTIPAPSAILMKSLLKLKLAGELPAQRLTSEVAAGVGIGMCKPAECKVRCPYITSYHLR